MRGSIRKRGRTYTWYLFVPDPATGKPRQRSKGGYRTKRECQAALNDALSTVRTGTFVEASRRTMGRFLRDEWLPAMQLNVRPTTWATYQGLLEAYVIPALGGIELQQLADPPKAKAAELQVWTPGQLRAFLIHVRQDRHYTAWLLAATTGMRRGELLGLRWIDVDLDAGRVAVRA
jgi:integrase